MKLLQLLLSLSMSLSLVAGPFAYVTNPNDNTITRINLTTNTIDATINLPESSEIIKIAPNNATAYVTSSINSQHTLTPINLITNTLGTPIALDNDTYGNFAITPDGKKAYMTSILSLNVTPIDLTTNTVGTPIATSGFSFGIAITPDGKTAYVPTFAPDTPTVLTPIDIATNTLGTPIPVGLFPLAVAITPDGKTAYVTNSGDLTISVINLATTTTTTINMGNAPTGIAIMANGKKAYVLNFYTNSVTPLDLTTNTPGPDIMFDNSPVDIAISIDNQTAYITAGNAIIPIDTVTNFPGTPIAAGNNANSIAITPATLPPAYFVGDLKKNIYNSDEMILTAHWQASLTVDVILYRIYKAGKVVDEILAGFPLTFIACVTSIGEAEQYEVAALSANNLESPHVQIKLHV